VLMWAQDVCERPGAKQHGAGQSRRDVRMRGHRGQSRTPG